MDKIVCIDCAQEVSKVPKNTDINVTLRNQIINTNSAFCEGCFKTGPVKYMCPFAHFMCGECGNTDMGDDWKPSEDVKGLANAHKEIIKGILENNGLQKKKKRFANKKFGYR